MSADFVAGFVACMIADVFFSIANFFVERALKERAQRKAIQRKEDNDDVC